MATPQLGQHYDTLRNYVKMVTRGYSNMLVLDADGGLGKTHTVCDVLESEQGIDTWTHKVGYTTPVELYKTLWQARGSDDVLFLDDMSGITSSTKAVDMMKSATDTQGDRNWVEYQTSQAIDHPTKLHMELPNEFCFRGSIIMSFNDTPDNPHFDALVDRGTYYNLSFDYQERIDIIHELAKSRDFSDLSISSQQQVAEWIESVTNPAYDVTIRTFEEVCNMYHFARHEDANWKKLAVEVFDIDYEKYLIIDMRQNSDESIEQQIGAWCEETGLSETAYYDRWSEIKQQYGSIDEVS